MEHKIIDRDKNGNYIDSKIFIDRKMLDKGTMNQIRSIIHNECVVKSRFMPDVHRGKAISIGTTMKLIEKVVPKFIGNDIGCGILTYALPNQITDFPQIDNIIRQQVPMGLRLVRNSQSHLVTDISKPIWDIAVITDADIEWACNEAQADAYKFVDKYKEKFGVNIIESCPNYSKEWFIALCKKIGADYEYIVKTIPTLGSGNHFIEVNRSINDHVDYITVHTGSRSIGDHVYTYHQNKINDTLHFDYQEYKHKVKLFERKTKVSKEIKAFQDKLKEEFDSSKHTEYLEGEEAYEYFFDMIWAQKIAMLNRRLILKRILAQINVDYDPEKIIESIHNYIDFNDMIIRKGAIPARLGEKCIVSLNMRDGILICEGLGNEDWNLSSAHGSGRMLARNEVAHKVSMTDFVKSMEGVYSTSVVPETIDESPMAYKDTELIKKALGNTVVILEQLKPIINVKATN